MNADIEVSGFKRRKRRGFFPRTDKGKKHNYPLKRESPVYPPFWHTGKTKDGKGYQMPLSCYK